MVFQTRNTRAAGSLFERNVAILTLCLSCLPACATTGAGGGMVSYELAHNTERSLIMLETSSVLTLYNFVLESSDERRDRGALQTFWRTNYGTARIDSSKEIPIRDRVFLHISPRGKSSIQYNVYQMVNATIQFEIQMREGDAWVDIVPLKEYEEQYKAIVRDIRNRMLRHSNEF
jgi:hypothetical protein